MSEHDAANILLVKEAVRKYLSIRPGDPSDCAFGSKLVKKFWDMVVEYRSSNDALVVQT